MAVNPRCRIIAFEGASWRKQGAFPCSRYTVQETKVIRQTLAGAAFATPALAQAVIEDPGYCAQFYPNANCQNLGPGNPYTDGGYYRDNWPNGYAMMEHHPRHRTHRHHHR